MYILFAGDAELGALIDVPELLGDSDATLCTGPLPEDKIRPESVSRRSRFKSVCMSAAD